jgi:Tfp pilus assembly protein FimT
MMRGMKQFTLKKLLTAIAVVAIFIGLALPVIDHRFEDKQAAFLYWVL